jgi:hypothetical protein
MRDADRDHADRILVRVHLHPSNSSRIDRRRTLIFRYLLDPQAPMTVESWVEI